MAFTKLEPTGVNTSATFTFANANVTTNLNVGGKSNLGPVGNVTITGGSSGQVLSTDGSGTLSWVAQTGGGTDYSNANVAAYLPTYTGNISANYFIGNGSSLTNITGGNVSGQVGSALIAGTVTTNAQPNITSVGTLTGLTTTGDITSGGTLVSNYSAGNEGGEIKLALPQTGTTLNSSVTIDMHQNRLRIFESGGTNRGGYYDITALGAGVSTDLLAGGGGGYANSNVAAYLLVYTGNIAAGNVNVSGNVTSAYFIGNGSTLSALNASNITTGTIPSGVLGNSTVYVGTTSIALNRSSGSQSLTGVSIDGSAGTVTTAAQPNITSVGTLVDANIAGNLFVGGNLIVSGSTEYNNVTNLYVKDPIIEMGGNANAGALSSNDSKDRGTLLHYYTTAPVDAFMGWDNSAGEFAFGSNVSMTSEVATFNTYGNVRASHFLGNGSQLTGVIANANYSAYTGSVTNPSQGNITTVGTLSSLTVSGLVTATAGGIKVGNLQDTSGTNTIQLTNSDILVTGNISAGSGGTGNVTATYFIGNGSQLTGLPATYANSNVANYLPTYTGNLSPSNLVVSTSANLGAVGNIIITGGSSGQVLSTDGTGILSWATPSSGGSYSNANVASYLPTFTGNFTAGNANISGVLSVSGSLTAGSGIGGSISGANSITANFFIGNGSSLTSITGANVTGTVANATYAVSAGTVTTNAQPNITSVGSLASLTVDGTTTLAETTEVVAVPTGTTYDYTLSSIFYVNQPGANFTPNFTNLPTTDNRITVITLIINQSATPGMPTAMQIGGTSQTIKWPSGTLPTGVASSIQTVAFAFLRYGAAWIVTGSSGAYL